MDWAVAGHQKYLAGSGDGYFISRRGDCVLCALIDGTGSGVEAQRARDLCLTALQESEAGVTALFPIIDQALRGSRGAAMAVVEFDLRNKSMTWGAVGDVDGLCSDASNTKFSLLQRSGTLGFGCGGVQFTRRDIGSDDVITLTTDGISRRYRHNLSSASAKRLAEEIVEKHGNSADDAMVFAARLAAV